ncbi:MAG TPA: hypothetical protein VG797_00690 [Phycisphaerales bacterium]|nr:hypothetical protein [Phycisphaerales bacterium]
MAIEPEQVEHQTPEMSVNPRGDLLNSIEKPALREKVASLRADGPYDWISLFPRVSGWGAPGEVKRHVKLLRAVEPRLEQLMFPDERIEFVTNGVLNSFVEQYFMGIWAFVINQTIFLFTNYRVVLVNWDGKKKARAMMWQIPYGRLKKYNAAVNFGSLGFKLSSGGTHKFVKVPRGDRKRLKEFMAAKLEQARTDGDVFPCHTDRDPLCPGCAAPLPPKSPSCPECLDEFVRPSTPMLFSMLLPGLGHLYLGHIALGVMVMLGFIFFAFVMIMIVVRDGLSALPFALIALACAIGVDALVTRHVARKGVLSKRLAWRGY